MTGGEHTKQRRNFIPLYISFFCFLVRLVFVPREPCRIPHGAQSTYVFTLPVPETVFNVSVAADDYQDGLVWQSAEESIGLGTAIETELWRPSPKVTSGRMVSKQANSLCPEGVLAAQGNLQPIGKVVRVLEENHRVSSRICYAVE